MHGVEREQLPHRPDGRNVRAEFGERGIPQLRRLGEFLRRERPSRAKGPPQGIVNNQRHEYAAADRQNGRGYGGSGRSASRPPPAALIAPLRLGSCRGGLRSFCRRLRRLNVRLLLGRQLVIAVFTRSRIGHGVGLL